MPANIPAWINLVFENNWGNYASANGGDWEPLRYRIWERSGTCEISGLIRKNSGVASVFEVIASLPPAAAPLNSFNLVAAGGTNNDVGLIQVTSIAQEGGGVAKIKYLSGSVSNIGFYRAYPVATA